MGESEEVRTAQTIAQSQAVNSLKTAIDSKKRPPRGRDRKPRTVHPNSLANLKPYEPGQSGNPGGRPKDESAEFARHTLRELYNRWLEGFAKRADQGDAYAFSVLSDRGFGKLKQGIIHTGDEDGGPINTSIKIEFVKPEGQNT